VTRASFRISLSVFLIAAGACRRNVVPPPNINVANKVAMRSISLYYESPQMLLAPELRNVPLPENTAAAIPVAVRELIKGPAGATSARVFPADTVVRAAYLLPGGTVIIDLGGNTLTQGWGTGTHEELMAAYSLVYTVTSNFPEARRVRILVNGVPAETLAGHLSLARSLEPMSSLVQR
jgi:spore germination protein GerM